MQERRFTDAALSLENAAAHLRSVLEALPAVVALPVRMHAASHGASIHKLPADLEPVMVLEPSASRVIVTSLEWITDVGLAFVTRDVERSELFAGSARRTMVLPVRSLPDYADALAEAAARAAALYQASSSAR